MMKKIIFVIGFLICSFATAFAQPVVIFTRVLGEGEFSISSDKKVRFSKGNLQHQPSTLTWRIAPRQYDFVGGTNPDSGEDKKPWGRHGTVCANGERCSNTTGNHRKDYTGWLDCYVWGASGWYGDDPGEDMRAIPSWRMTHNTHNKITCNPYELPDPPSAICIKLNDSFNQGLTGNYEKADWGVRNNAALGGTEYIKFRTPTKEEYDYLFEYRESNLRARGRITLPPDTFVNGLILFPDDWYSKSLPGDCPVIIPDNGVKDDNKRYESNIITAAQWQVLEENGATFLPAGGSTSKYNRSGFYWTASTAGDGTKNVWNVEFGGYGAKGSTPHTQVADRAASKTGRGVRLIVEITAPDAVINTFDDYKKVEIPGIGGSITSTQDEINHSKWRLVANPAPGYQFAYWSDLSGAKTYIDNTEITITPDTNTIEMKAVFVKSNAYVHEFLADGIVYRADTSDVLNSSATGSSDIFVNNSTVSSTVSKLDYGVWEHETPADFSLNVNAGRRMHVVLYNQFGKATAVVDTIVPVMISSNVNASGMNFHSDIANTSVQVFDGATLTIDADKTINGFLDIHAGGKVVVPEGKTLTVNGIIMRGNGITKEWPQLEVDGTITNNNNDTIYYDYTLDQHAYYPLTLPFDVKCSEVYNPINKGASSYLSYFFNTENRENGVYAWVEFNDAADGAKFEAGKGYIVYAVPTRWQNSKAKRQQEAIMRFPMVKDFSDGDDAEKLVDIYSNPSGEVYDCSNWNLIGNPYLKNITMGHVNVGKYRAYQGNLDGEGNFVEAAPPGSRSLNYITYSDDGFRSYQHEELSNFVMKPFNSYLTQTSVGSKLQFAKITTPLSAPRRTQANDETEIIRTGILLTQGDNTDHIGLLFGDYTYDYEVNADLAKQFGEEQPMSVYSLMGTTPMAYQALPIDAMTRPLPLGYRKADVISMTFSFDDSRYDRNALEELWLTDMVTGETVNLLVEDYTFTPESEQDDSRFYLSCERRKVVDVTTNVEETTQQRTIIRVFDMFGREMHGDVNALPQGVYILMDNLGNTSKEILGQ